MVQNLQNSTFHGLTHHMLPTACLGVDVLPGHSDDLNQQALGQPMLAHNAGGHRSTIFGEFQVAITLNHDEVVTFHPGDSLRDSGAGLPEALSDTSAQRGNALFLKFEDRTQVHFSGIDQIAHSFSPCIRGFAPLSNIFPAHVTVAPTFRLGNAPTRVRTYCS